MQKWKKFTILKQEDNDEYFMNLAIEEAKKALENGDVPIGAICVCNGEVISTGFNKVEKKGDSTAHAEMIAIKKAIKKIGYKHLNECSLYVTLEPCPMCSGAIVLSRIKRLIYGASDPKFGASGTLFSITNDNRLNHRCVVTSGVLEKECSKLLSDFFKDLRKKKK